MSANYQRTKALLKNNRGVTMLEYGILAALIAAVCIGAVQTLGIDVNTIFTNLDASLTK